jgi:hypothetical protein
MLYDVIDNNGVTVPGYKIKISTSKRGWPKILSYKRKKVKIISTKCVDSGGYPIVGLSYPNGKSKSTNVHQIIFHSLIGTKSPTNITEKRWNSLAKWAKKELRAGCDIDHVDDDQINFRPHNLELVTRSFNLKKRFV